MRTCSEKTPGSANIVQRSGEKAEHGSWRVLTLSVQIAAFEAFSGNHW